jgi:DNA/RNA-binding domain of Phe-tRNA-synthetase-like protein
MITKTEKWHIEQPNALIGILVISNASNLPDHPKLNSAREDLELELQDLYDSLDRKALKELAVFKAYDDFYRSFKKTYHVQLQLETVVFKKKHIYSPSALVACMFMAELKTGLLTAAHDMGAIEGSLIGDIASGDETYLRLDGSQQQLKSGDLLIKDNKGILSSVIYGPDRRTQINAHTDRALYTTYGPPGITTDQIQNQLKVLEGYVKLFAPHSKCDLLEVV